MTYRQPISPKTRRAILSRALCPCGAEPVEVDHIVAVCFGGGNEPDNLQGLCRACHLKKTRNDVRFNAKARRIIKKLSGEKRPRHFGHSRLRRKMNGEVVER